MAGRGSVYKRGRSWTIRYETQARVTQYWKYDLVAETVEK